MQNHKLKVGPFGCSNGSIIFGQLQQDWVLNLPYAILDKIQDTERAHGRVVFFEVLLSRIAWCSFCAL